MSDTPCVNSGFCCTSSPCPYGEWDAARHQCKYLTDPDTLGRRLCLRYDYIKDKPGANFCPAFGAGCCSPLFNTARQAVIAKLRKAGLPAPKR